MCYVYYIKHVSYDYYYNILYSDVMTSTPQGGGRRRPLQRRLDPELQDGAPKFNSNTTTTTTNNNNDNNNDTTTNNKDNNDNTHNNNNDNNNTNNNNSTSTSTSTSTNTNTNTDTNTANNNWTSNHIRRRPRPNVGFPGGPVCIKLGTR